MEHVIREAIGVVLSDNQITAQCAVWDDTIAPKVCCVIWHNEDGPTLDQFELVKAIIKIMADEEEFDRFDLSAEDEFIDHGIRARQMR